MNRIFKTAILSAAVAATRLATFRRQTPAIALAPAHHGHDHGNGDVSSRPAFSASRPAP